MGPELIISEKPPDVLAFFPARWYESGPDNQTRVDKHLWRLSDPTDIHVSVQGVGYGVTVQHL